MPFKTHGSTPPHSSPDDSINPTPPSSFSAESSDLMKFQSQESLSKDVEDHLARENPDIVDPLFYETIPVAGTGRAGSSLQQMTIPIHKSCGSSVSNNGTQNLSGVLNVKTRSETRKVIVRSPYFKQKPFIETMEDEEKENCQPDDDVPVSLPVKINGPLRAASKRKTFSEIDAPEIRKKQSVHADDLLENNGSGDHSLEPGEKPEKKFGANISHLDRYSSIAEKSLQRFVKVMDSFRFTGSGSRASGLRAPLKSAPNLLAPDRSTTSTPIEEFVYKPKSRKVALPSHRA